MAGALDHFRGPFAWGVSDCLLAPCNAILDARGVDPAETARGRYTGLLGAWRIIAPHGSYEGWCRATFGADTELAEGALCLLSAPDRPLGAVLSLHTGGAFIVKGENGADIAFRPQVIGVWTW